MKARASEKESAREREDESEKERWKKREMAEIPEGAKEH